MPIDNTGLNYSTIENYITWVSTNFAGQLANDRINRHDVSTDSEKSIIKEALLNAESEVNGFLRRRGYKTPIDSSFVQTHNNLRIKVYVIASFELYTRRGITKEQWYKYQRTIQSLEAISNGRKDLPEDVPFRSKNKISHGHTLPSVFSTALRKDADRI